MISHAFVVGATGFVGRQVVAQLAARGGKVTAHVRPDSSQLESWRARFTELGAETDVTPWQLEPFTERLRELAPSHVFLCLGTTAGRAKTDHLEGDPYETVDFGLTKLVIDAAVAAYAAAPERAPRLVYISSIGADPRSRSRYLAWRGKTEEVVRTSGLPWVMARPAVISESAVSTRDVRRFSERAAAAFGDFGLAVVGALGARRLRARYRSTTPEILAAALIRLAEEAPADTIADGNDLR